MVRGGKKKKERKKCKESYRGTFGVSELGRFLCRSTRWRKPWLIAQEFSCPQNENTTCGLIPSTKRFQRFRVAKIIFLPFLGQQTEEKKGRGGRDAQGRELRNLQAFEPRWQVAVKKKKKNAAQMPHWLCRSVGNSSPCQLLGGPPNTYTSFSLLLTAALRRLDAGRSGPRIPWDTSQQTYILADGMGWSSLRKKKKTHKTLLTQQPKMKAFTMEAWRAK